MVQCISLVNVALVLLLNTEFTGVVLFTFLRVGSEPTALSNAVSSSGLSVRIQDLLVTVTASGLYWRATSRLENLPRRKWLPCVVTERLLVPEVWAVGFYWAQGHDGYCLPRAKLPLG